MTNQEAVEYLDKYVMNVAPYGKWKEVVELAISALQAQEAKTQLSAKGTTSDLISRQVAVDAVDTSSLNLYDPEENWMMQDRIRELPSAQPEPQWIPVRDKLPEPLKAVIITWKNHEPQFYYSDIKNKPFTGVGIYYKDKWWWWSAYAEDMLAEYGDSKADRMDKAIEVIAWMPLPEPYRAERRTDEGD